MDVGLPDAARFGQHPLATAWEVGISSRGPDDLAVAESGD